MCTSGSRTYRRRRFIQTFCARLLELVLGKHQILFTGCYLLLFDHQRYTGQYSVRATGAAIHSIPPDHRYTTDMYDVC